MPINSIKNTAETGVTSKNINGIATIRKNLPNNSLFRLGVRARHLLHGTFNRLLMLIVKTSLSLIVEINGV